MSDNFNNKKKKWRKQFLKNGSNGLLLKYKNQACGLGVLLSTNKLFKI